MWLIPLVDDCEYGCIMKLKKKKTMLTNYDGLPKNLDVKLHICINPKPGPKPKPIYIYIYILAVQRKMNHMNIKL
jgi:hypothetical protein